MCFSVQLFVHYVYFFCLFFFFFQAEDGIRDKLVTGVQTCAFFFQAEDGIRDKLVTGVQCSSDLEQLANRREQRDHQAAPRVDRPGDEVRGENRGVPAGDQRHREVPGHDAVHREDQGRREGGEVQITACVVPPLFVGACPPDRRERVQLLAPPRRQVAHGGDVGDQTHDQEHGRDGEVHPDRKLVPDERRLEVGPQATFVGIRNQPVEVPLPTDVNQWKEPGRHH